MNSSDQNTKLPSWLFIVTDLALIGAAAVIALTFRPLTLTPILLIVGCVGAGAIVGLVPLVARFERQKNEALDDRQRALEALARTVSASAEQISIAAGGLHEIVEIAQKNLRHAEQLPHKLQDKIAEFHAQLATATDAEKEELERELLSLRTTESERLESVSQRIAKSAGEWSKLEAATNQHLTAAQEALSKLALGTASAIGKAQVAAEQALAQARIEAARSLGDASGQAVRAIESAKTTSLDELDAKLATATSSAVDRMTRELGAKLATATQALDEKINRLESAARQIGGTPSTLSPPATPPVSEPAPAASAAIEADPVTSEAPPPAPRGESVSSPESETLPPKRTRKARREEPPAGTAEPPPEAAPIEPNTPTPASPERTNGTAQIIAGEPAPIPSSRIPEIAPIAPTTADPFVAQISNGAPAITGAVTEGAESPKPPRRRPPAKKPEPDPEPALGLDLDDTPAVSASGMAERVISSDGATRLLVTAYIGIGNRLFIRGEGPGLSWEKGVPLQFVSIGKWRWETNDANAPVKFKLFKNEDMECSALGAQSLDPGYQQELTAVF